MSAMSGAEAKMARGMVRRASRISSPMNEADSKPVRAKAMVAQKIRSRRCRPGVRLSRLKVVAGPSRSQAVAPIPISRSVATQRACAPAVFSHLPTCSPTRLSQVPSASPRVEATMK